MKIKKHSIMSRGLIVFVFSTVVKYLLQANLLDVSNKIFHVIFNICFIKTLSFRVKEKKQRVLKNI